MALRWPSGVPVTDVSLVLGDTVPVRILKMGTEIDGWRFAAGASVTVTAKQAEDLIADKAARRVY